MKSSLDYRKNFLCVLAERTSRDGSLVREWYPVREADESEVRALVGRSVSVTDSGRAIFVDEGGNVFQLSRGAKTKPLEIEGVAAKPDGDLTALLEASLLKVGESRSSYALQQAPGENRKNQKHGRKCKKSPTLSEAHTNGTARSNARTEIARKIRELHKCAQLNLRQKLAMVRQRLGYIQKRGHNELHNYSYVTAADLAGAVGDILAELGVVVVPRLESISHEPSRAGKHDAQYVTHVVMNYTFVDVDTGEDITVKVAGQGADAGDKAPYKAMTGALKYALLQLFLLASGDDPQDERISQVEHSAISRERRSEPAITRDELEQLSRLIEETGTELERVLAYYKLSSLDEMTQGTYRRAVELLKRKQAKLNGGESAHAQN